jgi:hypothetical protein
MRSLLLALALVMAALPAAGQPFTIEVTKDTETVPPGGTTRVTVTITNNGPNSFTGRFQGSVVLARLNGSTIQAVTPSNPVIGCSRTSNNTAPNDVWVCFCDPVTIPAGGTVTLTADVKAPENVPPGTTINFGGTLVVGNTTPTTYGTQIVVGSADGPRLTISVRREPQLPDLAGQRLTIYYELLVTNTGNRPTEGEIIIYLSPSPPIGTKASEIAPEIPPSQGAWQLTPGNLVTLPLLKSTHVIQPNAFVRLPVTAVYSEAGRGYYFFTATVTGGGSPAANSNRDELRHVPLPDVPASPPVPPTGTGGRPR